MVIVEELAAWHYFPLLKRKHIHVNKQYLLEPTMLIRTSYNSKHGSSFIDNKPGTSKRKWFSQTNLQESNMHPVFMNLVLDTKY